MRIREEIKKAKDQNENVAKLNLSDNYDYIIAGDGWNKEGNNYGINVIDVKNKKVIDSREISYSSAGRTISDNNENMYRKQTNEMIKFYSQLEEGISIEEICRNMGVKRVLKNNSTPTTDFIERSIDGERDNWIAISRIDAEQQIETVEKVEYPTGLSIEEAMDYVNIEKSMGKASADAIFNKNK